MGCLERLMYPAADKLLVLHIALPVDAGALVPVDSSVQPLLEEVKADKPAESVDSCQDSEDASTNPSTASASQKTAPSKSAAAWAAAATRAAIAQAGQPSEFLQTLRSLEQKGRASDSAPLEIWVWQLPDRYYLLFLET